VSDEPRYTPAEYRRKQRLKAVFEGRKKHLDMLRELMHGPSHYSSAVIKYQRARVAWRRFRGWTS